MTSRPQLHSSAHLHENASRCAIVADGMLERRVLALRLTRLLEQTLTLQPQETTRRLADTVLEVAVPNSPTTRILMLDWHASAFVSAAAR